MSKFRYQILSDQNYPSWDVFLDSTVNPSPFLKTTWLRAFHKARGEKFEILGCYKNDELIAGFPYTFRIKFGRYKLIVNLLGLDNYIVFQPRQTESESKKESHYFEIYQGFINYLETSHSHIELTFNAFTKDVRPFQWAGYKEELRYTYIGSITDPQTMLKAFNPDIRNKIKKAEKLDYQLTTNCNRKEIKTSYGLIHRSLSKNKQAHIMTEEQFVVFCEELDSADSILVANVYLEKKAVASRVIIKNSKIAIDFQAGGDETLFNTGLNQLLSFKIFEYLYRIGINTYDFRGANTPSIAKYKSAFNFVATPYYVVEKNRGLIFKTLLKAKEILG